MKNKNFEDDLIGYKIKLYPTFEQEQIFKEYFGACRFVYNLGIKLQEEHYRDYKQHRVEYSALSYFNLIKLFNKLKHSEDLMWLNNYSSYSLTTILKDVCTAYDYFFKGICKYPKLKKKKFHHQMFPIRPDRLNIDYNFVRIPNIGNVACYNHNNTEFIGTGFKEAKLNKYEYRHYYNSRIIFDGYSYWLCFSLPISHENGIEANSCKRFKNNEIWKFKDYSEPIGIDLGCKGSNWIVDSRGNRICSPDTSKEERQMAKYKRKLAIKRKVKEKKTNSTVAQELKEPNYSKNEEKILKKLNKASHRRTNKKKNAIHEYACYLVSEKPSCVILESLNTDNMMVSKNEELSYIYIKKHNKSIYDSMLYSIKTIITNKCNSNNIPVILADREYPSSQLCSRCGYRQKIGKSRVYKCPCCGLEIDRDYNAALNLMHIGYENFNQYDYIIS